jgi:hypothetical protein
LPSIVFDINHTENSALGNLTPADVNSPVFDPLVRDKRVESELKRSPKTEDKSTFKEGDFVYISFKDEPFIKSFDFARGMIYKIKAVDKNDIPYLYILTQLNGSEVKTKLYSWQLKSADNPDNIEFPIEKVLKKRKVAKKTELFVKWLHYPNSYNSWVNEGQVVT